MNNFASSILHITDKDQYVCVAVESKHKPKTDPKHWQQKFFTDVATLEKFINAATNKQRNFDLYVAMSVFSAASRRSKLFLHRNNFSLDIDSTKPLAELIDMVNDAYSSLSLPNPSIISTGGGVHTHLVTDKNYTADEWLLVAGAIQTHIVNNYPELAKDTSRWCDLSAVLRPPGSTNNKPSYPQPYIARVEQTQSVVVSHTVTDVLVVNKNNSLVSQLGPKVRPNLPATPKSIVANLGGSSGSPPPPWRPMFNDCAVLAAMVDDPDNVSYGDWYNALNLLAHTDEPVAAAHHLSEGYGSYDAAEVDDKIEEAVDTTVGPTTCAVLSANYSNECEGCVFNNHVKSPISTHSRAGLAAISSHHPMPDGFFVGAGNSMFRIPDQNNAKPVLFASTVFYVADIKELVGTVTIERDITIEFERGDGGVGSTTFSAGELGSAGILSKTLNQAGLVVHNDNAAMHYTRRAMGEWQKVNPITKTFVSYGFQHDLFISPFNVHGADGSVLCNTALTRDRNVSNYPFKVSGTIDGWRTSVVERLINYQLDVALFCVCLSAGTPLLQQAGNGIMVMLNGVPGAGKSLTASLVHSVWGEPTATAAAFTDTYNAVTEKIAVYKNLPVTFDEITSMDAKDVTKLIYQISQGQSKGRLNRDGSLNTRSHLSCPTAVFATSNKSLADYIWQSKEQALTEALYARVLEIDHLHPMDKSDAKRVVAGMEANHGVMCDPLSTFYAADKHKLFASHIKLADIVATKMANVTNSDGSMSRFYARAGAAAVIGARLLNKAFGKDVIDPALVLKISIGLVEKSLENLARSNTEPAEALLQFIAMNADSIVVEDAQLSNGTYHVKVMPATGRIYEGYNGVTTAALSIAYLKDYCAEYGHSFKSLCQFVSTNGLMIGKQPTVGIQLYGGTRQIKRNSSLARVTCLCFDYDKAKKMVAASTASV